MTGPGRWRGAAGVGALVGTLVALHVGVRPLLPPRLAPDFLVLALLFAAGRLRPGVSAVVGLVMGLLLDVLSPAAFGAGGLAYTVVGYAASRLKAALFADNLALTAAFLFAGKWAADVLFLAAEHRLGPLAQLTEAVTWAPLAAAVTAGAGALLVAVPGSRPAAGAGPGSAGGVGRA